MSRAGATLVSLGERIGRVRPDRIPAPYLCWVVACWLVTVVLAAIILLPGATDGIVAEPTGSSGVVGIFTAPLGIRVLVVAAAGILAGTLLVALLLRERLDGARPGRVAREFALAAAGGFPVLALAADREWVFAAAAFVVLGLTELAAHRPGVLTAGGTVLVGLLTAAIWGVLLVAQLTTPSAAGGWAWIALFGFAAAFAAFGSYYGVARAAESRVGWLRPLFRDDLPTLAVVGIVAAVVVLVALRLTVARDLFPPPDPELWSPLAKAPVSWVHAAAVAALLVVVAARSVRVPLRRARERRVTAALAVAGNADLAVGVAVILVGMVLAAAIGGFFSPDVPPVVVAALKFLGVVAVTVVALLPPFRGTAARALAVVSGAYLIPLTLNGLLGAAGVTLPPGLAGYPASPVQVMLALVAVAVVAGVVPALRAALGTGLVVRLALVPLVAVHAGWLLPAAWTEQGRVVFVVGVLLAVLFFLPRLADDRDRHALDVFVASGGQVLALVVFALAIPSFLDDPQLVVLGLFWLAVAVIAASTVRVADGDEAPDHPAGSSSASSSA
ncbi:hypothetical protein [Pseudolysinimonas yzui]|uniref:Uncharacterized protein n=1 Tax=Pseudolysinimonas yzui TaxID=2708254 RepID=A0A8J3LZX4_9MICO|nr:hypothetical protein [Pseudolysinimonas yzui]GHF11507.1 hypothetical protein GCM10011600_10950 [Pseudolysinimonas yzui]